MSRGFLSGGLCPEGFVWGVFVLEPLLTNILIEHACQHNSFWGSRCDSSHASTLSLKLELFAAISAHLFGPDTSPVRHTGTTKCTPPIVTNFSYFDFSF